jgi:hypothetical protein
MEIKVVGDIEAYGRRLRDILSAAVATAREQGFDREVLDLHLMPSWFVALTGHVKSDLADIPVESLAGRASYYEARQEREWDIQEWLFCFDPELRRWLWWDLTTSDSDSLALWLDTKGELVVACEELWWAVYAAGAIDVRGFRVGAVEELARQSSVGIGGAFGAGV